MNYQLICETMIASIIADSHRKSLAMYNEVEKGKRQALAIAAQILIQTSDWMDNNDYNASKSELYKVMSTELQAQQIQYLPKNARRFQEAVLNFRKDGILPSLPRMGIKNASKADLGFDVLQGVVTKLVILKANYTYSHVLRKAKEWLGAENGIRMDHGEPALQMPSDSWFYNFFAKKETEFLTSGKYGDGKVSKQFTTFIPLARPLHADDCWQCDGTKVNFIPYYTNEKTKSGARKEQKLIVVIVRDLYSGSIRGCAFGVSESHELYRHALNMAVQSTNRLPYEIVFDRFPGHSSELWKAIHGRITEFGTKIDYSSCANRKGATERWFNTIQTVFYQDLDSYTGEGIMSQRKFAHRGSEYITKQKAIALKENRSYSDAVNECDWCFARHEKRPYSEYSQARANETRCPEDVYNAEFAPAAIPVRVEQRMWIFEKHHINGVRRGFINCTIDKVEYKYRLPYDVDMKGDELVLIHDGCDYDVARIYALNGEYLGVVEATNRIQVYGKAGEAGKKQLGVEQSKVKAREAQRKFALKELLSKAGQYEEIDESVILQSYRAPKHLQEDAENVFTGGGGAVARLPEPMSDDDSDDNEEDFRNLY